MKKFLLTLSVICLSIFLPQVVLGDGIETEGTWGEERHRTIVPNPPTLSLDGNLLSVYFKDTLNNLTIRITDENGNIMYENTLSGEMGDTIGIPVDGMQAGTYQVTLSHELGWLVGEFENQ